MVISRSKHTLKPRVPQASSERPFQPNKINANTTFDFEGKEFNALRRSVSCGHDVRETQVPGVDRRNYNGEAEVASDVVLPIPAEHGAGDLCGILALASSSVCDHGIRC